MEKQLLIFDLDGTLADTCADLAAGMNLMRTHYGLPVLPEKTITGYIGGGIRQLVKLSLEGADADLDEAVKLAGAFYLEHLVDQTVYYPHAKEGIATLAARGHVLAVLSNKDGDLTRRIVNTLGQADCFVQILGGGDLAKLKPSPDGIDFLLKKTGMTRDHCWMIGDHHTDLEAARNAGVNSGYVSYGIGHPGEFKANCTWQGFDEVVAHFC